MQAEQATHGQWVATLSNGSTATEGEAIPGQLKPWAKLCALLLKEDLYITSLRYNVNGKTYHAPRADVRWNKGAKAPLFYAVENVVEGEMEEGQVMEQHNYVDIAAVYEDFSVHTIVEIGGQQTTWTEVRYGYKPMRLARAFNKDKE